MTLLNAVKAKPSSQNLFNKNTLMVLKSNEISVFL